MAQNQNNAAAYCADDNVLARINNNARVRRNLIPQELRAGFQNHTVREHVQNFSLPDQDAFTTSNTGTKLRNDDLHVANTSTHTNFSRLNLDSYDRQGMAFIKQFYDRARLHSLNELSNRPGHPRAPLLIADGEDDGGFDLDPRHAFESLTHCHNALATIRRNVETTAQNEENGTNEDMVYLELEQVYHLALRLVTSMQELEPTLGLLPQSRGKWFIVPPRYPFRPLRGRENRYIEIQPDGTRKRMIDQSMGEPPQPLHDDQLDADTRAMYEPGVEDDSRRYREAEYTVHICHHKNPDHWTSLVREKSTNKTWHFDSSGGDEARRARHLAAVKVVRDWLERMDMTLPEQPETNHVNVIVPLQGDDWTCSLQSILHPAIFIHFGLIGYQNVPGWGGVRGERKAMDHMILLMHLMLGLKLPDKEVPEKPPRVDITILGPVPAPEKKAPVPSPKKKVVSAPKKKGPVPASKEKVAPASKKKTSDPASKEKAVQAAQEEVVPAPKKQPVLAPKDKPIPAAKKNSRLTAGMDEKQIIKHTGRYGLRSKITKPAAESKKKTTRIKVTRNLKGVLLADLNGNKKPATPKKKAAAAPPPEESSPLSSPPSSPLDPPQADEADADAMDVDSDETTSSLQTILNRIDDNAPPNEIRQMVTRSQRQRQTQGSKATTTAKTDKSNRVNKKKTNKKKSSPPPAKGKGRKQPPKGKKK